MGEFGLVGPMFPMLARCVICRMRHRIGSPCRREDVEAEAESVRKELERRKLEREARG